MLQQTLKPKYGWVLILPDFSLTKYVISKNTSNTIFIVFFAIQLTGLRYTSSSVNEQRVVYDFFDTLRQDRDAHGRQSSHTYMNKINPWLKQVDHKLKDEQYYEFSTAGS